MVYDCAKLCRKSHITRIRYSLPSESQWEYACRSGTNTPFYFGDISTPDLINDGETAPKGIFANETTDVGSFPPNAFGLYDMHGNVEEWCLDTWHENYNDAPKDGTGWTENYKDLHVLRGGSCNYSMFSSSTGCRSTSRNKCSQDISKSNCGFRVICTASAQDTLKYFSIQLDELEKSNVEQINKIKNIIGSE